MQASQLSRAIQISILAGVPMITTGEPGGGKTQIHHGTFRAMGRTYFHQCLAQTDPIDVRGVPYVRDGITYQATPEIIPQVRDVCVFLDEFTKAPALVMNAWAEAICEGTIGGKPLPVGTRFLATGNRKRDRAGEVEMPSHLKNRFMHIPYTTDVEDWVRGAYNNFSSPIEANIEHIEPGDSVDPMLIGFIRHRPNLLHNFSTTEDAYPTPRSIGFVSKLLPYLRKHPDLMAEMIGGCVGAGFAIEFTAFLQLADSMPDPDEVMARPDSAPIPENPSVMYALIVALAAKQNKSNVNGFFRYMQRIPGDYALTCVHDAIARDPLMMQSPEGMKFATRNFHLVTGVRKAANT